MDHHDAFRAIPRLAAGWLIGVLLGCGSGKAPPPSASGSTGIKISAAQGGVVEVPLGARLSVPPGAVSGDVTIAVSPKAPELHAASGVELLGRIWSFQVDGRDHYSFAKPVRVSVPVETTAEHPPSDVTLSVWQDGGWSLVPGSHFDPATRQVSAEVGHFSEFAPTKDKSKESPQKTNEQRSQRFLEVKNWYGSLSVQIHGTGKRSSINQKDHFNISREAHLQFMVRPLPGELTVDTALDIFSKGPGGDRVKQSLASSAKSRSRRHWSTGLLDRTEDDETDLHVKVADLWSSVWDGPRSEGGPNEHEALGKKTTGGADERVMGNEQVEVDPQQGTYSLTLRRIQGGELEFSETGPGKTAAPIQKPCFVNFSISNLPLPSVGTVITGSRRLKENELSGVIGELVGNWSFGYGKVHGIVAWTLSPVPLEEVELVLAPENYDDWLPRGGANEDSVGNVITVKAEVRRRDGRPCTSKLKDLTVRFSDVSQEAGVCLNQPQARGATSVDLKFAPQAGVTLGDGGMNARKQGEFPDVTLTVNCYDWGAWGALSGEGMLTDGRLLQATLDTDPSAFQVLLPKRRPDSKIADKWKSDMGVDDRSDLDDSDPQRRNRNDGDGLSLYEEYRGLIAKGKHTRDHPPGPDGVKPLTPRKKDLIVSNEFGSGFNAVVQNGFALFDRASDIHIVEVTKDEMTPDHQININRGYGSVGEQFGLRLIQIDTPGDDAGGVSTPKASKVGSDMSTKSPRGWESHAINVKQIRDTYAGMSKKMKLPYTVDQEIASTIAHELAHGLGVEEHGSNDVLDKFSPRTIDASNHTLHAYAADGSEIKERPFTIEGTIGPEGSESSGDVNCIMCYNAFYSWAYHPVVGVYNHFINPPGTTFCTSEKATGTNAPHLGAKGGMVPGLFGPALLGNCLGQMKVRDH